MEQMHKKMAELVLKQLTGETSEEEIIELNRIRSELGLNQRMFDELLDVSHLAAQFEFMNKFDPKASWKRVQAAYPFKRKKANIVKYLQLAAAVICSLMILSLILLDETKLVPDKTSSNSTACIADTMQYKSDPWNVKTTNKSNQCKPIEKQAPEKLTTKLAVTEKRTNKETAPNHDIKSFENTDLQTILRWLHPNTDYEIVYTEGIRPMVFTGFISREYADELVEQVLSGSGLGLTIEGNKYIVHRS